jgi:hypothetical protein
MKDPGVKHKATPDAIERKRARARAQHLELTKLEQLDGDWAVLAARAVTKAEQVDFIIEALRAGVYRRGLTTKAMCRVWNVAVGAVVAREVEALRSYARALDEHSDVLAAELALRIQSIGQSALERTEEVVDRDGCVHEVRKPDHRTALAAAVELAELAGLRKTRIEVDVMALSDEQIRAQLAQHGIKIVETTAEPALPAAAGERA